MDYQPQLIEVDCNWSEDVWAWKPDAGRWSPSFGRPERCVHLRMATAGPTPMNSGAAPSSTISRPIPPTGGIRWLFRPACAG